MVMQLDEIIQEKNYDEMELVIKTFSQVNNLKVKLYFWPSKLQNLQFYPSMFQNSIFDLLSLSLYAKCKF
jgi:hypothetical protein